MTRRPTAGVGSNQYQERGASNRHLPLVVASEVAAAVDADDREPWERVPLSAVKLHGGYTAKGCATKTQHDSDPSMVGLDIPSTPGQILLLDRGNRFESGVFADIEAANPKAIRIPDGDKELQKEMTAAAMRAGAPVILGGWLPDDDKDRRTGKPDILMRVDDPMSGKFGYMPVDVKFHTIMEPSSKDTDTVEVADQPGGDTSTKASTKLNRNYLEADGMQVAHYWRQLEAVGMAAPGRARGGVIDKSGQVVTVDLEEPTWAVTGQGKESMLDRYDREWERHMQVARQQVARNDDASVPAPAPPRRCGDCPRCKWRKTCADSMDTSDHVSLIPGLSTSKAAALEAAGVTTRAQVALMNIDTARLAGVTPKIDLPALMSAARGVPDSTPIERLMGRKHRQIELLQEAGVMTAGDAVNLDEFTAEHASGSSFAKAIDDARAATSGRFWRARGAPPAGPPRAAREIHLDMENSIDHRVYLWGANTIDRAAGTSDYNPVVSWQNGIDDRGEAELLSATWEHLGTQAAAAAEAGQDMRIVIYTKAEETQMRRIAAANDAAGRPVGNCPTVADVDGLVGSDRWVDANAEVTARVVTGGGNGLKDIAPHAGHSWSDPYASGEESMVFFEAASTSDNPAVQAMAQRRVLDYNREDTEATHAVLNWLDRESGRLPPISSWQPPQS